MGLSVLCVIYRSLSEAIILGLLQYRGLSFSVMWLVNLNVKNLALG